MGHESAARRAFYICTVGIVAVSAYAFSTVYPFVQELSLIDMDGRYDLFGYALAWLLFFLAMAIGLAVARRKRAVFHEWGTGIMIFGIAMWLTTGFKRPDRRHGVLEQLPAQRQDAYEAQCLGACNSLSDLAVLLFIIGLSMAQRGCPSDTPPPDEPEPPRHPTYHSLGRSRRERRARRGRSLKTGGEEAAF